MDYCHANSPAVVCLAAESVEGVRRDGIFAVFTRTSKHPAVFQTRQRETLLTHMKAAASKKLGVSLKGAPQHLFAVPPEQRAAAA
jgi:hypothetical protein